MFQPFLIVSGRTIRREMRRHRVTIRELARRLGIPQRRVRDGRFFGVEGFAGVDWLQAIRGLDDLDAQLRAMFHQIQQSRADL